MARNKLSQADHAEVSAAIAAAELQTDGEIVTIVTAQSDPYRDVTLHYALLLMLVVPVKLALLPQSWIDWASSLVLGWNAEWTRGELMLAITIMLILAFLLGRWLFSLRPVLMALTPKGTKARRVRRQAISHFRTACEGKTRGKTGILIYLSLLEHRAEIVADQAINDRVRAEEWGEAMALLVREAGQRRIGHGMALAVAKVGAVLAEHLPRSADDTNELEDRLVEL
jgi:putative membrane protein